MDSYMLVVSAGTIGSVSYKFCEKVDRVDWNSGKTDQNMLITLLIK